MTTHAARVSLITFLLVNLLAFSNVNADPRFILQDSTGFCISLTRIDDARLAERLAHTRDRLRRQQSMLIESIDRQGFNTLDTMITVVMPGGLLYAAFKHQAQRERRQRLSLMKQELRLLSADLLGLQSTADELKVAVLR